MDKEAAKKIYNVLDTLNESLVHAPGLSHTIRDGSWNRLNSIVEQLATAYNDEIFRDYIVQVHDFVGSGGGHPGVFTEEFKRKAFGATLYLHSAYLSDVTTSPTSPDSGTGTSGHTFIQEQSAQQHIEVSVEFNVTLMQVTEKLTKAEAEYPDENSKEHKFIKRMKATLPVAKNAIAIIAAVLRAAHEYGLTPAEVQKILHL